MRPDYKDAKRPVNERVADLLARMTPEEKFAQMHAYWLVLSADGDHRERSDMSDEFAGVSEQVALAERLKIGVGQITRPLGTHIVEAKTGVRRQIDCKKCWLKRLDWASPRCFTRSAWWGCYAKMPPCFPRR